MSIVVAQIPGNLTVYSQIVQVNKKENIKAPDHLSYVSNTPYIGPVMWKSVHAMTS